MKTEILSIRDAIKTAADEQVSLRKARSIIKTTQEKSDGRSRRLQSMHWEKISNRADLRHLYLAYAYARGRSYLSIEAVTNPNKLPYLDYFLTNVLGAHGIKVTREQVKAWIAGENPQIPEIAQTQSAAE